MSILKQASLLMIPSGYKEDKLYSVKPTDGSGDLNFTRSSAGTRVNSDGFIEDVPWNLITYSEDFLNASWVKSNVTIETSINTSPLGYSQKIVGSNDTLLKLLFKNNIITPTKTISALVKAEGYNYAIIFTGGGARVVFDLVNGVVGHSIGTFGNASINSQGDGWYIISMSNPNHTNYASVTAANSNSVYDRTGNGVDGISLAYIQVNKGTTAKTYFPTTDRLNVPRIDYTGGGCGKLLIEPQSTNSLIYSEQFDNSYWTKTGVSIIANDTIAPDGTMTADRATNLFTGQKNIQRSITSGAGAFSVYAKKGVGDTITLITLGPTVISTFNLQNGTASGVGVIQEIGNGWYRCSIPITGTTQVRIYPPPVLNDYVYLWGAQLEGVTVATSYIPTSGTTVTRTQDTSSTTSSNIAAAINSEEGVQFIDFDRFDIDGQVNSFTLARSFQPSNNYIIIAYRTDRILGYIRSNGVYQTTMVAYGTWTMPRIKVAFKWKVNDFALWINGVEVKTDTSGTTFAANSLDTIIFSGATNQVNQQFNARINAIAVYDTALSDEDLTTLTTL